MTRLQKDQSEVVIDKNRKYLTAILIYFFSCISRPVRRNSLNATGGAHRAPHRTRTHAQFSRAYTTAHHPHISSVSTPHWLKVKRVRVIFGVSHPSRSLMSFLNVPFVRFPSVLSSPTASSSKPSASTIHGKELSQKPKRTRSLE